MHAATCKRLKATGGRASTVAKFLGLRREDEALTDAPKRERRMKRLSRKQLADRIESNPSRIAKLEAGGPGATLDLLIQALLVAGTSRAQVARPSQAGRVVEMVVHG